MNFLTYFQIGYHLFLLSYAIKKTEIEKQKKDATKPNIIEKIVGIFSFLVLICQIYYRINEERAIYMLNPCHCCLVELFFLFSSI